jgi:hypothetical protein
MSATPAAARRVGSEAIAALAERQAEAVAALDRAVEARLGEIDRAVETRRRHLEGRLNEAETRVAEAVEAGVGACRRAVADERRLFQEEAAAQLAALEASAQRHARELEEASAAQAETLRSLIARLESLEREVTDRSRSPVPE